LKALTQIKPASWIKFAIYGLLILGIYYSTFTRLITHDWEREAYTYCWLIPPIVFFLIWLNRDELALTPSEPSWIGLLPVGFGVAFFWLGELGSEFYTQYISFWMILIGLCLLHLGWQKVKTIGFALFFILVMFPVPHFIDIRLMLQLRIISSKLGVAIIQAYGMPVIRQGNIIDLGFTKLQVVDACSGLHSLISLVVLSLLIVYFFKDHIWKRAVLFFSSIPLAIVINSFRIAMTAILFKYFGAGVAEGFFHQFSGVLIFFICIPILLIEMKVLEKLPPVQSKATSKLMKTEKTISDNSPDVHSNKVLKNEVLFQPMFIVALILLGSTLAMSYGVDFSEKIPIKKNLEHFPLKVDEWTAVQHQKIEQKFLDVLDLSEYVVINYQNRNGKKINFYVAYYESQRKGSTIHTPASCLPASGWSFDQSGTVTITNVPGIYGTYEVNRAVIELGQNRHVTYYWFPCRGRILNNAYQIKMYNIWDSLTKHRTDGALVRLITSVYEDEKLEDAEKRLQGFVRDVVPVLEEYLPGKDIVHGG